MRAPAIGQTEATKSIIILSKKQVAQAIKANCIGMSFSQSCFDNKAISRDLIPFAEGFHVFTYHPLHKEVFAFSRNEKKYWAIL